MQSHELFVFAGAGASYCRPAALPMFLAMRDEILHQLELDKYIPDWDLDADAETARYREVAAGLNPEPFMSALKRADMKIGPWLADTLRTGSFNAVHRALAELAGAGTPVWTVNFDTKIEDAATDAKVALTVSAFPDPPAANARLLKPHGTLDGELILDSEQVLRPLRTDWEDRLHADVQDRTVVFLGYSGKDRDFQPVWDRVLAGCREVLWFDVPNPADEPRRRAILRSVDAAGRLAFPPPTVRNSAGKPNPSADFVRWCQDRDLVAVSADLVAELDVPVTGPVVFPILAGDRVLGRIAVRHVIGDVDAAKADYRRLIVRGPDRRSAVSDLLATTLNHGGRAVSVALAAAQAVPPIGSGRGIRTTARRKRVSVLTNLGRHHRVARITARRWPGDVSTVLALRSGALRMTGSLDESVDAARAAMKLAEREQHPVRLANAAFQAGLALVWAYRLDEAEVHLADHQRSSAQIAATRWVAWADFVEAGLMIHRGAAHEDDRAARAERALTLIDEGFARFQAEDLLDGQIDMLTIRLTALRLAGCEDSHYRRCLGRLRDHLSGAVAGHRYARGQSFTREAIALEVAEFARLHTGDLKAAQRRYQFAARSKYRIHAALGHLGLAAVHVQQGRPPGRATTAVALGQSIGARIVVAEAKRLQAGDRDARELFIP